MQRKLPDALEHESPIPRMLSYLLKKIERSFVRGYYLLFDPRAPAGPPPVPLPSGVRAAAPAPTPLPARIAMP